MRHMALKSHSARTYHSANPTRSHTPFSFVRVSLDGPLQGLVSSESFPVLAPKWSHLPVDVALRCAHLPGC